MSWEESEPEFEGPIAPSDGVGKWFYIALFLVALICFAGVATPVLMSHGHPYSTERSAAVRDCRAILDALHGFHGDYGKYPNEETLKVLQELYPDAAGDLSVDTANDCLMQLVVTDYLDEDVAAKLKKGELMFTYVMWGETESLNGYEPLLIMPMVKGKLLADEEYSKNHFDKRVLEARVHLDLAFRSLGEDGKIKFSGYHLFDDSLIEQWGNQTWKVVWPE